MRDILSGTNRTELRRYFSPRTILVLGFDGVLAPIVAERQSATLRSSTRASLVRVADVYPTAVVSGRSRADLLARLDGVVLRHVLGNHGLEARKGNERWAREIAAVRPIVAQRLEGLQGVEIEDKGYSLSIHYRRSTAKAATLWYVLEALEELGKLVAVSLGEQVVEVTPQEAPTRADAVRAIARGSELRA